MSALAASGAPVTMSTVEIASRAEKQHAHVMRDVRDMWRGLGLTDEEGQSKFGSTYLDAQGKERACYSLPQREFLILVSGYSVDLRSRIIDRWHELETSARPTLSLPNFGNPADAARAWAEQYEARTLAERTKAEIGARREATAMNTASQAVKRADKLAIELDRARDYATVKRMQLLYHGQQFQWRMLKHVSAEMGLSPIDVFDANYGTVKAYHADVWREAYALEILAQADAEQGERASL